MGFDSTPSTHVNIIRHPIKTWRHTNGLNRDVDSSSEGHPSSSAERCKGGFSTLKVSDHISSRGSTYKDYVGMEGLYEASGV